MNSDFTWPFRFYCVNIVTVNIYWELFKVLWLWSVLRFSGYKWKEGIFKIKPVKACSPVPFAPAERDPHLHLSRFVTTRRHKCVNAADRFMSRKVTGVVTGVSVEGVDGIDGIEMRVVPFWWSPSWSVSLIQCPAHIQSWESAEKNRWRLIKSCKNSPDPPFLKN